MKEKSIVIACYTLLVLAGGIIGHIAANSLASLITSSIIAVILFTCSAFIWNGNKEALGIATVIVALLVAFFTYRFFLSYKLAPSGLMAIVSAILFVYLLARRKK